MLFLTQAIRHREWCDLASAYTYKPPTPQCRQSLRPLLGATAEMQVANTSAEPVIPKSQPE